MAGKRIKISIGTFDLVTGLAVLLVIAGHVRDRYPMEKLPMLFPVYFVLWIFGAGLMPLFFIISGMGFKQKPWKKILKKTFAEMVVPYLWAIPLFVILFLLLHNPVFYNYEDMVRKLLLRLGGLLLGLPDSKRVLGYEFLPSGVLWFFLTLFIAQNILNLILRVRKTSCQIVAVIVCILTGYLLYRIELIYYCIPQGLMSVGFCYIGYIIKKWNLLERWMYSPLVYICLISVYLIQYFLGGFNMASGEYNLLSYLSAGCGGILFLLIAVWCSGVELYGLDFLRKMGTYSFWIIYTHGIEVITFPWYEIAVENPSILFACFIEIGMKVIISMIGCMVFRKISRIKLHRKLGKISERK